MQPVLSAPLKPLYCVRCRYVYSMLSITYYSWAKATFFSNKGTMH